MLEPNYKYMVKKVFHNFEKDPPPKELDLGTLLWILYTPDPKVTTTLLRSVHLGLLPHIEGIKGWALPEDITTLFLFGIEDE